MATSMPPTETDTFRPSRKFLRDREIPRSRQDSPSRLSMLIQLGSTFYLTNQGKIAAVQRAYQNNVQALPARIRFSFRPEALAAEGKDENEVGDVLTFFRERLRPFPEAGAAVLIAYHVTKSTETRGRWARGSGAKLARYDAFARSLSLNGQTPRT